MSATKRFYEAAAAAGMCPIDDPATVGFLDGLESEPHSIDWIEYCEFDYEGFGGKLYVQDCIRLESAKRLISLGLATDEIEFFVECWGGVEA